MIRSMRQRVERRESSRATLVLIVFAMLGGCVQGPREHPDDVKQLLAETRAAQGPRFSPLPREEWVQVFGTSPEPVYRFGNGDVLHIWGDTDFLRGFGETTKGEVVGTRVKPDGQVYLPVLGAVPAMGRTVIELQEDIRKRLKKYKDSPFVSVDLIEPRSQKFFMLGAVSKPGVYPVDGQVTLLEGFSHAGGASPEADIQSAYVVRDRNVLPVSLADLVLRGDTSRNIYMRHGDLVFVPSREEAKVYVLGEVRSPGAIPIRNGRLTLVAAVSAAQGLIPESADQNVIRVFRGGWGSIRTYTLSASELYAVGADIGLYPGDRILVAPTQLATFQRSLVLLQPFITATTSSALLALGVSEAVDKD